MSDKSSFRCINAPSWGSVQPGTAPRVDSRPGSPKCPHGGHPQGSHLTLLFEHGDHHAPLRLPPFVVGRRGGVSYACCPEKAPDQSTPTYRVPPPPPPAPPPSPPHVLSDRIWVQQYQFCTSCRPVLRKSPASRSLVSFTSPTRANARHQEGILLPRGLSRRLRFPNPSISRLALQNLGLTPNQRLARSATAVATGSLPPRTVWCPPPPLLRELSQGWLLALRRERISPREYRPHVPCCSTRTAFGTRCRATARPPADSARGVASTHVLLRMSQLPTRGGLVGANPAAP